MLKVIGKNDARKVGWVQYNERFVALGPGYQRAVGHAVDHSNQPPFRDTLSLPYIPNSEKYSLVQLPNK